MRKFFTSESVTEGHPDKLCDIISDSILDEYLKQDKFSRVACETTATSGVVFVMGEITSTATVDVEKIVRDTIRNVGYIDDNSAFSADNIEVIVKLKKQSPDIALGVDNSFEVQNNSALDRYDTVGAGDQGMMFGYATCETEEYMPLAYVLASKLTKKLTELRKNGTLPYLLPDGKAQVTVETDGDKTIGIDTVVVSTQHKSYVSTETLREDIKKYVISSVIPSEMLSDKTKFYINPTGRFEVGGPEGDCGLTGRKIIVDTYGGFCPHGGGAFSGKDPTKVDRSASYMARFTAKNIVASGLAKRCRIDVSYAIGVAKPVSMGVDTFGTGVISDEKISQIISAVFDFRPLAIIEKLQLRNPIYKATASNGHFGKPEFIWEKTTEIEKLKKYL